MKLLYRGSIVGCASVCALLIAAPARAETYIYHAERGLPTAQGWVLNAEGGSQVGSQTVLDDTLTVTDNDPFDRAFNYSITNIPPINAGVGPTGPGVFFQMRSLVRIGSNSVSTAFGGGNPFDVAPYQQLIDVDDSSRTAGFAIRYNPDGAGSNEFKVIINSTASIISLPWDATSYYEVVLTKPATTNTGALVTMTLEVFSANESGISTGILLGSTTFGYGSLNGFAGVNSGKFFGNSVGGAPTGTFDLKWATFGIGEFAPQLVPEPSVALLGALGALWLFRKRNRA